jgi:hypothetical protein
MSPTLRFAALLALFTAAGFAETWSGPLVDSKCYGAVLRNVNPTDTETYVDRDGNSDIRYCSPSHKTKLFAIVTPEGERLKLDPAGNAKAAELLRNVNKKHLLRVTVTGQMVEKTIQADSIAVLAPQ